MTQNEIDEIEREKRKGSELPRFTKEEKRYDYNENDQENIEEIQRRVHLSQKQKEQWRDYVDDSLKHPLDNRYSSQEGFGRDDQTNIKEILRKNDVVQDHIETENKKMTLDPLGYELYNSPENILPAGVKDKRRPLEKEEVTNPKHYNERKMEPLDYIIANELDFLEGNIVKYITRYTYKGGVNDLLKARTYLEKLIERERDGR